jgi:hypothetical protein
MTAPGWYPDAHGALRWWDGAQWTEHTATAWAPPQPAAPRRRRLPPLWLSAAVLLAGAAAIAGAVTAGLPDPRQSLNGPRMTVPGQQAVTLAEGPWTMFERTGTSRGGGGVSFTEFDSVTFGADDVVVSGPQPVTTRSALEGTTETLNRGGALYTGAVRFDVQAKGSYTITVRSTDPTEHEVILARPLSYSFRHWRSLLVLVLGALALVAGGVLLVLGILRQRDDATLQRKV